MVFDLSKNFDESKSSVNRGIGRVATRFLTLQGETLEVLRLDIILKVSHNAIEIGFR